MFFCSVKAEVAGSSPAPGISYAAVAQLVEQRSKYNVVRKLH